MTAVAVEINDFSYRYPDGTFALGSINLRIEAGERVALIGPNGAGKSTLLLAMAGFIRPAGKISIYGSQVNKKNIRKIRRLIGSCLQNPDEQLFMPSLFDDVAFGPLNMNLDSVQIKKRVTKSLEAVALAGFADKSPHHLSSGQKRAAAIATILSMSPEIITFDEPDSSLDPASRKRLAATLKTLPQTLIIATCNMAFAAEVADRAVLLDAGEIIADGDAGRIMADPVLMQAHGLEVAPQLKTTAGQN